MAGDPVGFREPGPQHGHASPPEKRSPTESVSHVGLRSNSIIWLRSRVGYQILKCFTILGQKTFGFLVCFFLIISRIIWLCWMHSYRVLFFPVYWPFELNFRGLGLTLEAPQLLSGCSAGPGNCSEPQAGPESDPHSPSDSGGFPAV